LLQTTGDSDIAGRFGFTPEPTVDKNLDILGKDV
jgi:hypothetical protein